MSIYVFLKLFAIFFVVAIGYVIGRLRLLPGEDPARTLSGAAFYIFMPALFIRTVVRLDFSTMPWATLAAFFGPVLAMLGGVYVWQRRRRRHPEHASLAAAAPSVRAISATFGNTLQVGLPLIASLYGEAGTGVLLTLVSLHALTLLTVLTTLVELDLARERRAGGQVTGSFAATLATTMRNTIIHPVVLPVLFGLAWNFSGIPWPVFLDEICATLSQAVVPLCLVLIGMSLAYYSVKGAVRSALLITGVKLLALPALVLLVGHWGFGLTGIPLAVVVMTAALPTGSNALIFSQRYGTLEAETTAISVVSTLFFAATAPLWLLVIAHLS